jgi:hypothetical protein
MHDDKQPERRTYLQERFEILIKRQKEGTATFNQLTELDEIVNRDPELRERVIREDILMEDPSDSNTATPVSESESIRPGYKNVFEQIRAFLQRIFNLKFGVEGDLRTRVANSVLLV